VGISVGSAIVQNGLRVVLAQKITGRGLDVDEVSNFIHRSTVVHPPYLYHAACRPSSAGIFLSYIDQLDPVVQGLVRSSYEQAVLQTFWFTTVMTACPFISSLFMQEKRLGGSK